MKRIITNPDLGLLALRFGLAAVFLTHGVLKLVDLGQTVEFFAFLNLPPALAYLVAVIETLGGLAMLLGLWSRLAGGLLALVMVGAIYSVKWDKGFVNGYEFDLILLTAAVAVALIGAGRYTVNKIFSR